MATAKKATNPKTAALFKKLAKDSNDAVKAAKEAQAALKKAGAAEEELEKETEEG